MLFCEKPYDRHTMKTILGLFLAALKNRGRNSGRLGTTIMNMKMSTLIAIEQLF